MKSITDVSLYDAAYGALHPEKGAVKPGYRLREDPRHGVTLFELPYEPGRRYVMAGDPGTGNYPGRGAACVMVADCTTKPYRLVYFDWVSGNGSINPFLASYKYAIDKYMPEYRGIDATGPQTMMDELAFVNYDITTDRINFGKDKDGMLNTLAYDVSNHLWKVPPIKGLLSQASTYSREMDKKLAQDIIMTWMQISFLARFIEGSTPRNERKRPGPNYRRRNVRTTSSRRR